MNGSLKIYYCCILTCSISCVAFFLLLRFSYILGSVAKPGFLPQTWIFECLSVFLGFSSEDLEFLEFNA